MPEVSGAIVSDLPVVSEIVVVIQGRKKQVSQNLFLLCWSAMNRNGCQFHRTLSATGYVLSAQSSRVYIVTVADFYPVVWRWLHFKN